MPNPPLIHIPLPKVQMLFGFYVHEIIDRGSVSKPNIQVHLNKLECRGKVHLFQ